VADDFEILIDADGGVQFVYDDAVAALYDGEPSTTARASHVEPFGGGWIADMRPVGGPVLYADGPCDGDACAHHPPFPTRAAALGAEVAYLRERMADARVEPVRG